jgi:UrcA family protein
MKTLIAVVVAGLAAGAAGAQDRIAIDYTDVESVADADALYQRIVNAAGAVCPQEQVLGLYGHTMARRCVRSAVTKAVADVDNPLLTARHHGETPATLYSSRATRK